MKTYSLCIAALFLFIFTGCNTQQSTSSNQSSTQRPERQGAPPSTSVILEQMDTDKDGQLSEAEVKGPLKSDFAKIDANRDGYLSKEELDKAPKPDGKRPQKRN